MTESPPWDNVRKLKIYLDELRMAHRDLDAKILGLTEGSQPDEIELRRLKKQKLALKDLIARIESHLIPDIIA